MVLGIAMVTPTAGKWRNSIRPFYADSMDVAKVILRFLIENQPKIYDGLFIQTIQPNEERVKQIMSAAGIAKTNFTFKKQHTSEEICTPYHKTYAISSLELHGF